MFLKQFLSDLRSAPRIIKTIQWVWWAIVDPNWFWFLNYMLVNAKVPSKYKYLFFPLEDNAVFLDCGMNVWLITDIARKTDMEVYWFEPNPACVRLLNKKYKNDKLVHIYPCAVSNEEWQMDLIYDHRYLFAQWATIFDECAEIEGVEKKESNVVSVPVRKLTTIIKQDILPKHKHIYLCKIDIEWAEFWVVNDIINEWLYKDITYIVVETHERFFKDWKKMLNDLNNRIKENKIDNIFLDRF